MKILSIIKSAVFFIILTLSLAFSLFSTVSAAERKTTNNAKLNVNQLSMVKESSFKLRLYNTTDMSVTSFDSKDTDIVSINNSNNKSAELFAKDIGTTTITASIKRSGYNTIFLKCNVTVGPNAISIKFKRTKMLLKVGVNRKIKVIIKPINTTELPKYTSSDPSIATVSSNGMVNVLAPGKTTISASISSGQVASYKLIASPHKDDIATTPNPGVSSPSPTNTAPPIPSPTTLYSN